MLYYNGTYPLANFACDGAKIIFMRIQEETRFDVLYDIKASEFVIAASERDASAPAAWVIHDGSGAHGDPMDIETYFHELCNIFAAQIREFESLKHQATAQEKKRLQTTLNLTLEAQELLHDEER